YRGSSSACRLAPERDDSKFMSAHCFFKRRVLFVKQGWAVGRGHSVAVTTHCHSRKGIGPFRDGIRWKSCVHAANHTLDRGATVDTECDDTVVEPRPPFRNDGVPDAIAFDGAIII